MIIDLEKELPIIPGRGLVTAMSTKMRLDYLHENEMHVTQIANSDLELNLIQNNIESYIGTVDIPVGIVGPLKFNENGKEELVYTLAGTLEGALVASMNRGAKAISMSGGFKADVLWQKMSRAPLFIFETRDQAVVFKEFIEINFSEIKKKAETHSNHASLLEISPIVLDNTVHAKFIYTTGDASGQNMTTTCTWHAMLFITENFFRETGIPFVDFILEGNGSSDKKISSYSTSNGRGVNVTAECFLPEKMINQVLRTTSQKMEQAYLSSVKLAKIDGMFGYNINVANAISSIYVTTGQDLGCIHESSVGILNLTATNEGLFVSLTLPNLVIGTVGGGTHLPKQSEALAIMKCKGNGKVERFAKLIAGFAMGLELSTFAAIVSGEFAKAHEKLGRNKPVDWLLRNELNEGFLKNCLTNCPTEIVSIELKGNELIENGILTHIAGRASKKLIGFETFRIKTKDGKGKIETEDLLLKSKALDEEVIKGLHVIAASIDPELSNLIRSSKDHLEYKNCHLKETEVYTFLVKHKADFIPAFMGQHADVKREIHILILEFLDHQAMKLMNSENSPEKWDKLQIKKVIQIANDFHSTFLHKGLNDDSLKYSKTVFEPWKCNSLYNKLVTLLLHEEKDPSKVIQLGELLNASLLLEEMAKEISVPKTIVHNDFNPRNISIRENGDPAIYDWELAMLNYPHRDIVEFLSFVLTDDFTAVELLEYLEYFYSLNSNTHVTRAEWFKTYQYSTLELIITRILFYEVAGIVVKYDFSKRILNNALRMLTILKAND